MAPYFYSLTMLLLVATASEKPLGAAKLITLDSKIALENNA